MKGLYPQASGEIAIIFLQGGDDYQEVCKRVTPNGAPYLIVPDDDLPTDWSTSAAWEADFSNPDGFGMGAQRYFIAQAEAAIVDILARVVPDTEDQKQLIAFFTQQDNDQDAQLALIEQMKAEVFQLEGVTL